jgi:hypothetical protein
MKGTTNTVETREPIELAVWVTVHGAKDAKAAAEYARTMIEQNFMIDVEEIQDPEDSSTLYAKPIESEEAA